jgi:hypothetical protein
MNLEQYFRNLLGADTERHALDERIDDDCLRSATCSHAQRPSDESPG